VLGTSPFTLMAAMGAAIGRGEDHHAVLDRLGGHDRSALGDEHARWYGGFTEDDLYPDVRTALAALVDMRLRVVLAGNQPAERSPELRALGLPAHDILTSAELGAEKPGAAFFAALLDRLGVGVRAADVVYVGDRVDNDIGPAAAAEMRPVWLRRGPWALLAPGSIPADVPVVSDLHAVVGLVRGWREREGTT
jgi:FMN phosphatase YigB (HAD superfamily)